MPVDTATNRKDRVCGSEDRLSAIIIQAGADRGMERLILMSSLPESGVESRTISRDAVREFVSKVLVRQGMFAAEAGIAADRLLDAEIRHRPEFGLCGLPDLIQYMELGDIDPRAKVLTVRETPVMAVLDGSTGVGQVAVTKAMEMAMKKARDLGLAAVVVKNSQPCGDPGVYVYQATCYDLFGVCVTSTDAASVIPLDGSRPLSTDHAFSWGLPVSWRGHAIVSGQCAATSFAAMAYQQKQAGAEVAADQMVDAGSQARMWGGIVAGLLTSALAGGKLPINKKRRGPFAEASEHLCLALDPEKFGGREHFLHQVESLREHLPAGSVWDGTLELATVTITAATDQILRTLGEKQRIPVTW